MYLIIEAQLQEHIPVHDKSILSEQKWRTQRSPRGTPYRSLLRRGRLNRNRHPRNGDTN